MSDKVVQPFDEHIVERCIAKMILMGKGSMRKFLLIFTILWSPIAFTSSSFAEWTEIGRSLGGEITYIDFNRIRKHDGLVYFWVLEDLLKPDREGDLSYRNYVQGDCKVFRLRYLSGNYHKAPMGTGPSRTFNPQNPQWVYPTPNSVGEAVLRTVCSR